MKSVTARAPAKLILTGEHAVLQGVPALAIALTCYCDTTISSHSLPQVLFDLANLKHKRLRTLSHLKRFKTKVQNNYDHFLKGKKSILNVLREPFHLLEYTTSAFIDRLNLHLKEGFNVKTHSDIPSGYGLGSSAAAIVSTNFALNQFNGENLSLNTLFQLNLDAENLQHGHSSGLDIQVSAHGGCLRFIRNAPPETLTWPDFPLTLILTGKPASSTGECVAQSQAYFSQHPRCIESFHEVSQTIENAMLTRNFESFKAGIQRNQALLEKLGVIPQPICHFIQDLAHHGFTAKVCGAGSISGENAGVVAVFANTSDLDSILRHYPHFICLNAEIDLQGVRLIPSVNEDCEMRSARQGSFF